MLHSQRQRHQAAPNTYKTNATRHFSSERTRAEKQRDFYWRGAQQCQRSYSRRSLDGAGRQPKWQCHRRQAARLSLPCRDAISTRSPARSASAFDYHARYSAISMPAACAAPESEASSRHADISAIGQRSEARPQNSACGAPPAIRSQAGGRCAAAGRDKRPTLIPLRRAPARDESRRYDTMPFSSADDFRHGECASRRIVEPALSRSQGRFAKIIIYARAGCTDIEVLNEM